MITITNVETYGWEAAIRGMRNPIPYAQNNPTTMLDKYGVETYIGDKDLDLMKRLRDAGTDHRKFMRMITVSCDITAPLYWWKEFDTYKVGTVANSCSTMHKIQAKEFTLDDFSCEHLFGLEDEPFMVAVSSDGTKLSPLGLMADVIKMLNGCREKYIETKNKDYWWQMIQLLPSIKNQIKTNIHNNQIHPKKHQAQKNHKHK